jgi:hypothetical protein
MLSSVTLITLKKSGTSTLVANLGGQAMSPKFWEITRRIHHNVEIALAAILFAFVIYLRECGRRKLVPKMHGFVRI